MACINPDGTLSVVAKRVLTEMRQPHTAAAAARAVGLPLFRIRATVRETSRAGLIAAAGEDAEDGPVWRLTDLGEEALEIDAGV